MDPQPVDVNKLKNILSGAKKVMQKVESGDFETGNIDARALTEEGVAQLQSEGVMRPQMTEHSSNIHQAMSYTEEDVRNSKLPDVIKKAMIERPIPQLQSPNHTFNLSDVSELVDKPMGLPRTPKAAPKGKKQITESYDSGMITVSKEDLTEMVNNIVNERLLEFFTKNYNKIMTEQAVKKTISLLMKEGKIPKKTL